MRYVNSYGMYASWLSAVLIDAPTPTVEKYLPCGGVEEEAVADLSKCYFLLVLITIDSN